MAPRLPEVRLEWAISFWKWLPNQVSGVVLGEEGFGPVFAGLDPREMVPRVALLVCCGSQHGTSPQQGDVAARRSLCHGYRKPNNNWPYPLHEAFQPAETVNIVFSGAGVFMAVLG